MLTLCCLYLSRIAFHDCPFLLSCRSCMAVMQSFSSDALYPVTDCNLLLCNHAKQKWDAISEQRVQNQSFEWHGTISYPRVGVWIKSQPCNKHRWSCNSRWQEPDTGIIQKAQLGEIAPHELQQQARILQQKSQFEWDNNAHNEHQTT